MLTESTDDDSGSNIKNPQKSSDDKSFSSITSGATKIIIRKIPALKTFPAPSSSKSRQEQNVKLEARNVLAKKRTHIPEAEETLEKNEIVQTKPTQSKHKGKSKRKKLSTDEPQSRPKELIKSQTVKLPESVSTDSKPHELIPKLSTAKAFKPLEATVHELTLRVLKPQTALQETTSRELKSKTSSKESTSTTQELSPPASTSQVSLSTALASKTSTSKPPSTSLSSKASTSKASTLKTTISKPSTSTASTSKASTSSRISTSSKVKRRASKKDTAVSKSDLVRSQIVKDHHFWARTVKSNFASSELKQLLNKEFSNDQAQVLQESFHLMSRNISFVMKNSERVKKTHKCLQCNFSISHQCIPFSDMHPFVFRAINVEPDTSVICQSCQFAFYHTHSNSKGAVPECRKTKYLQEINRSVCVCCADCHVRVLIEHRLKNPCAEFSNWSGFDHQNQKQFYEELKKAHTQGATNIPCFKELYSCKEMCCLFFHRCDEELS